MTYERTMDVMEKASSKKRLIDANALIKEANADGAYGYVDAKQIADATTVDAVEVVRCKDCKHRYSDSWCEYVDDDDNFYCARGEWKEGAD